MTKEFIDNGNELIALYVGAIFQGSYPNGNEDESNLYYYKGDVIVPENWGRTHSHTTMKYHSSWDWLMPVVHKLGHSPILPIRFQITIDGILLDMLLCQHKIRNSYGMDIDVMFRAVVLFIKYLNAEKLHSK